MQATRSTSLAGRGAASLASLVLAREASAREVVEAHLAQIAEHNPGINALVHVPAEDALAQADAVDAQVAGGAHLPLAGVPFSVKDIIRTAGVPTTWGSRLLRAEVPHDDAAAVTRIRRAGGILIGKANTPEFGLDIQTDNALFGATRNPVSHDLTPGGSSGGDSAAVASGFCALGVGTDYGGSIRWPAQCTGVFGIRPTAGLVPGSGQTPGPRAGAPNHFSLQGLLQVIGPIAPSVADGELALRVMAGPDPLVPAPEPYLLPMEHVDVGALRIGHLPTVGQSPQREDLSHVVSTASAALAAAGCEVEEVPGHLLAGAESLFTRLRLLEGMGAVRRLARGREHLLSPQVDRLLATDTPGDVDSYVHGMAERELLLAQVLEQMERTPIMLMPVSAIPAFPVGTRQFMVEGEAIDYWQALAPSRAISLLGLPAASVPFGWSVDRLPVSVQVVGRPFHDHEVLAVAGALESLRP